LVLPKGSAVKGSSSNAAAAASQSSLSLASVLNNFYVDYQKNTPRKLKIIDAYLFYIFITGE